MPNEYVNKVELANGTTLIDITDTTAVASDVASGKEFYLATGEKVTGTAQASEVLIVDTPDVHGGTVREITAQSAVYLQGGKTVTPTSQQQTVLPDQGYDGFSSVIVGAADNREDLTIPKDVDFIDFDGRLLYSYTAQEFLALEEMPANPSYPGLVAQGWNWTLADAKEYVAEWGALVVGQNYTTNDNKTRIYITVSQDFAEQERTIRIPFGSNSEFSVRINWGDNTAEDTLTKNTTTWGQPWSPFHLYQNAGNYVIEITVVSGNVYFGYVGANSSIVESSFYSENLVTKIEIGNGFTALGRQPFKGLVNLTSVSIPTTCNNMDTGTDYAMFEYCHNLRGVVFPSGIIGKDLKIFPANTMYNLCYVAVPKSMSRFQMESFPRNLRKLTLPPQSPVSNTKLNLHLYHSGRLTHLIIPGTYTEIGDDTIRNTFVKKLIIPASVTALNGSATFRTNVYLVEIHMLPTVPPSMSNVGDLADGPFNRVIYVPYSDDHSILEAYQTATNWSTYASQMQEQPQS